jgi:hypothetical protein
VRERAAERWWRLCGLSLGLSFLLFEKDGESRRRGEGMRRPFGWIWTNVAPCGGGGDADAG